MQRRSGAPREDADSRVSTRGVCTSPAMKQALPDIISTNLDVLFCGINPGLMAAMTGHHFVGRSNRFWKVLHQAGFTPEELSPQDDHGLLKYGYGITSVIQRPTANASELSPREFTLAARGFEQKIAHYQPHFVAFLGKAAYAGMGRLRSVDWGLQRDRMHGAAVWALPNPSGRNRSFSLDRLAEAYRELYLEVLATRDGSGAPHRPTPKARS
ncbi:G/U mismatch-specific DNA glycosylase [Dyella sp. AD56]|nr:G/U mismatch-specific DNA glycosylase [Dyella sp. AD56]